MKPYIVPALIGLAAISMSSCRTNRLSGEGSKGSSHPMVSTFNAVEIELPIQADITVQEGATPMVRVDGYENVLTHIMAKVQGNKLKIYTDLDETWEIDCDDVVVHITVPAMASLSLSGAPDADIHGNIAGDQFKLDISGASTVTIDNINVNDFSSEISGAAEIKVKGGTVKRAAYEVSGAGKIIAFPLKTEETSASISGAGKGEVTASQKLMASISGAGQIKYKGHPSVSKEVSGVGAVDEAN
jgi:hypothetical protein